MNINLINRLIQLSTPSKISVDWDETGSTDKGHKLIKNLISRGNTVYIITARNSKDGIIKTAKELGIPANRVIATGSNSNKVKKIKELGIKRHYDNNNDVIKALIGSGTQGILFK